MDRDAANAKEFLQSEALLSLIGVGKFQEFRQRVGALSNDLRWRIDRARHQGSASAAHGADRQSECASTRPDADAIPQSREDAFALLNISADTPFDVANKIYWAMAKAWHVDHATSEVDRKRREHKMVQLNAAKEFSTGKRA